LTPTVYYRFGAKFSAGIRYKYTKTDYLVDYREDSTENRPIFDLVYNLNSTTSFDLEYQDWQRDYDIGTSDYSSNQVKFIFRKQYKFFELEAGAGYHSRDFEDTALPDIDVFTYRFGIIGQNPTDAQGMPRSHLAIIAESNLNDSGIGDIYFTATRFTLKAGRIFFDKFPAELSGRFQNSDYERQTGLTPDGTTEIRDDDLYAIEGSLAYLLNDWLNFKLSAGHEKRDSNIAGRDYDNNYFKVQLNFSYGFGRR
jgi:hypothetical protein